MNRQRRMAGLIFILGLILGFGIWQQRSQAAGQARQWLQHFAPATGGNHVASASAFGVSPAAAVMFAPTFVESGATLTLTLSAVNETLSIVSNGTSYTFTSNNLAVAGTSVTFNNSGANVYTDNFDIVLDDPGAGRITFNGMTNFTGANTLRASTSRNILVSSAAQVTTADGDLTLLANQQATPTAADFIGIWVSDSLVRATGAGDVIVKGKGGSGSGSGSYGIFVSGSNAQITANGGTVLVEGIGGGVGTSPANIGVGIQSGAVITNAGTSASATVTVRGFGGNLTGTSGNSNYGLAIAGTNTQITASGGAVLVEGTGGGAGTSNLDFGVHVDAGGVITNTGTGVGATVTVRGFGGNLTGTGGDNHTGVNVNGATTKITANGGAVLVEGTGGGAGTSSGNSGVIAQSGGVITNAGTGASATVTVRGTGGNLTGSGSQNHGVLVNIANAQISASGGAVLVEGTGGGAGTGGINYGVWVASDGIISNAGTGTGATVTVRGTGGNLTGTGNQNSGVLVQSTNTQITSSGGAISVIGSSGGGTGSPAIWLVAGGQIVATTGTPTVTLSGDSMTLQATPSVNAGTNPVVLEPRTAGTLINLGGADVLTGNPLTLGLTDTELDQVTAGSLTIGDNASGTITVSTDITRPASTNLSLVSGGDVTLSGGQVNTGGGTLLLDPGVAPFAVKPTKASTDVTASTLFFGSDLAIVISGLTVDTQYTQLNVAGAVNLTGVDLILSGAFVPTVGNVFTIVTASNVTGIFNGLPNGSTVTFNGRTLQIAYTATTVTLTVPNTPPTITAGTALSRQRGSSGTVSTIATVGDTETAAGSLVVTATTVPTGITVTSITNTAGTITATVAASCTATIGANTVVLTVTDGNSGTATANLTVNVTANAAPTLTYAAASVNAGGSTTNSPTTATDNGSITGYSVQSQGTYTGTISVNASGVVSVSAAAPVGAHTITIRATDNCGTTTDATFTLTVNNTLPTITAASTLIRQQGSAGITATIATVSDAETAAGSLTVAATTVPSGISVTSITNSNGTVSANVAASCTAPLGNSVVVLTVTDANGGTSTANLTVNVIANVAPSLVYPSASTALGSSTTVTPTTASDNGLIASYSIFSVTPPMTVAPTVNASGVVSITSAGPFGSHTIVVRATDNCGTTTDASFTLNVGCGTIAITPATLVNGLTFVSYSQTLTATGGGGSFTFSLQTGSLPAGLTLSGNVITGTPTTAQASTFTIRATDDNGCFGDKVYTLNIGSSGLMYYPLARPVRLLDTRPGASPNACNQPNAPIAANNPRTQPARGTCEGLTIPANATTITGHITTVQSGGGSLTLYPSDAPQPNVTNSNYLANEILNNAFTVGLGVNDGAFKLFVGTNTDVVIDVTGYYAPPASGGLYFHPLPKPIRLLETRSGLPGCQTPGAQLQTGTTRTQTGVLTCDGVTIPTDALALVGNATTTNSAGNGYLTLYPANATQPFASSSNFAAGVNRNAPFTVGLSPSGEFNIYTARTTDLVIDVMGYYSAQASDTNGQGLLFNSLGAPLRLLDTRAGQSACYNPGAAMTGQTVYTQDTQIPCTNLTSVARGLVGNVSALNATANGFVTFWPSNATQPTVATSNYQTGRVFNRHFTVGLGPDVAFKRYVLSTTDLIIDISGFFAP